MESLRKRAEPSRHLPETGLPRSSTQKARGAKGSPGSSAAAFVARWASCSELYDNLLCSSLLPRSNAPLANQYESYESTANSESSPPTVEVEIWKHNFLPLQDEEPCSRRSFKNYEFFPLFITQSFLFFRKPIMVLTLEFFNLKSLGTILNHKREKDRK